MAVAWGSDTAMTQLTSVGNSYSYFSTFVQLAPNERAHFQVKVDNGGGTPTDHAIIGVWVTLDDTSEQWDTDEWDAYFMHSGTDPRTISFIVRGPYKVRIGVKSTGSTDTYTADCSYRIGTES